MDSKKECQSLMLAEDTWVEHESVARCRLSSATGQFQFRSADTQAEVAGKATDLKRCFAVSAGDDVLTGLECMAEVGQTLGQNCQGLIVRIHMSFAGNLLDGACLPIGQLA